MDGRGRGLYYNRSGAEILAVALDEQSPRSPGWEKISDDPTTKLLGARRILVRNGASEDEARGVYWRANEGATSPHLVTDEYVRRFRRASDAVRERADGERLGIIARLIGLFPWVGHGTQGTKPLV